MNLSVRVRVRLLVCLLVFVAAGCGSTEPLVPLEGTYDMRSVNGQALPVTLSTGDALVSAVMVINADQSFVVNPTYRRTTGSTFTTTIDGIVTRTGDDLAYADPGSPPFATGHVTNGSVTFVQPSGDVFLFQHR